MDNYIEIRCPNIPKGKMECGHLMGFVPENTLVNGYSDVRYCTSCNVFWKISIINDLPKFVIVEKNQKIKSKDIFEKYELLEVEGNRVKNNVKYGRANSKVQ